ncbi:MAG TPA: hypothetical protein VGB98_00195 [Pyrinomonadaceae bacterium]|jgi:hypothetical protein
MSDRNSIDPAIEALQALRDLCTPQGIHITDVQGVDPATRSDCSLSLLVRVELPERALKKPDAPATTS